MDGVIESSESEDLSEGQQLLLKLLKEKHDLADDRTFAMWLRVPLMRSKQKWVLAGAIVATLVAFLLAGVLPIFVIALVPLVGLAAVAAFTERDVLSFGPGGLMLHQPWNSKLDEGKSVSIERNGTSVIVDGVSYRAESAGLDTIDRLSA